jgi:hypothetical protein
MKGNAQTTRHRSQTSKGNCQPNLRRAGSDSFNSNRPMKPTIRTRRKAKPRTAFEDPSPSSHIRRER